MRASDRLNRVVPYLERALENEYAQERLEEALTSARAAYTRAAGRKAATAAQDKKLQSQLGEAARSLREAASALRTGRQKPKRRAGRRVLVLIGVTGAAGLIASGSARRRIAAALAMGSANGAERSDAADRPARDPVTT